MIQIEWKHIIEENQNLCHIIQTWNSQRYIFGGQMPVGTYEGGHGNQSHDLIYIVEHRKILIEDRYDLCF